ncbi:cystathione beta-lyase [Eubacterium uniforme]|uniref:cysteine-S-conjugate beta-lyase n=1 Tax=Eubacterium uniforme TaxID=39495 RepID=A0A1T4V7W9_9FIRM|nr:MalY/PatB family protein [Eubacterium uniforme]SKA61027.1 cystathione beta-lyase [Eubacterium uniforme]
MKYDFDRIIDRKNTYSEKWKVRANELPMWAADMDFETAPEIKEAMIKRVNHGIFGYTYVPDEWYDAYINWWDRRYEYMMEKESLMFCTSIVPAITNIIKKLTNAGDGVIIMTPIYNAFATSIISSGRVVKECPLKYIEDPLFALDSPHSGASNGHYEVDWDLFESLCKDEKNNLLIFCNPQNPTGTLWCRKELERIGEICSKYGVVVISDEIHCDLTVPYVNYTPFARVNEVNKNISIMCISPTKTFNLAGLFTSAVSVANKKLREKVFDALYLREIGMPNPISIEATIAAYNYGEVWLDELRKYIYKNVEYVRDYILQNFDNIKVVPSVATYLVWIDISGLGDGAYAFAKRLRDKTGLWVIDGETYGTGGKNHIRLNVAAPRSVVEDAMNRLKEVL